MKLELYASQAPAFFVREPPVAPTASWPFRSRKMNGQNPQILLNKVSYLFAEYKATKKGSTVFWGKRPEDIVEDVIDARAS